MRQNVRDGTRLGLCLAGLFLVEFLAGATGFEPPVVASIAGAGGFGIGAVWAMGQDRMRRG